MFQRYIRITSGANQIFSVCWIQVNICPRYNKDGHEVLTKGKSALIEDWSWIYMWAKGPRALQQGISDTAGHALLLLLVIVSDGVLDGLCRQSLTHRWYCWCIFSDLLGVPLGQPDLLETFAAEGSLLERRWWINQCNLSCWLCSCSRLLHQTVYFVWLEGFWCHCSLCVGFQPRDVLYLQLTCGSWPNSELNQS